MKLLAGGYQEHSVQVTVFAPVKEGAFSCQVDLPMACENVFLLIIAVKTLVLFKGTREHSINSTGRQAEWQRKLLQ